ncbi:MAG: hypothetical protein IBX48_02680 [Thiomicrospira sp.]|uniref:hypothetical protein n=1 Tax=Thiomicrospira sp. TaxID=935 RepID=UPI0019FB11AD|nr:hypothetical protein [Thiomicrospira sp.]MBE0493223.1 hypothetical protein [Thiomicrospira sp.]
MTFFKQTKIGLWLLLLVMGNVYAQNFKLDDRVFVGFPSTTIRDDAFIVGKVTRVLESGDYQISVEDYVEGHDYGAFCTPVAINLPDRQSDYGEGWERWEDTRKLDQPNLEYIVTAENVMAYRTGQYEYIERNNTWVVFGRWMSDAPILAPERIERAKKTAESIGLEGMADAFDLAIAHRFAFYENGWGRPYWPYETVSALNGLLDKVDALFEQDPALKRLWQQKPRAQEEVKASSRNFFLMTAIDKLVNDAYDQLYEDLEKADPEEVQALTKHLEALGKPKI